MKLFFIFFGIIFLANANAQHTGLFLPDGEGGVKEAIDEKRVALIIGNRDYQHWGKLTAPLNDVELMDSLLKSFGFEVTKVINGNRSAILDSIRTFSSKISGGETVSLLYYAGHGIEVEKSNYLIAIDDNSSCRDDVLANGISLDYILSRMKNSGSAMNIMIVDACRNQPLPFTCEETKRSGQNKSFSEFRPSGTFLAFSTSPGQTAEDVLPGTQNSPYILSLRRAISTPGLKIEDVFKQANRDLIQAGRQEPWVNNAYYGDFYFSKLEKPEPLVDRDGDGILDNLDKCPDAFGVIENGGCPLDSEDSAIKNEETFFEHSKNTRSVNALKTYINLYKNGQFIKEANELLTFILDSLDHSNWETAKSKAISNNTIDPIDEYLKYEPRNHVLEALELKSQILNLNEKDEADAEQKKFWYSIRSKNNIDEVLRFIKDNKYSPFLKEAVNFKNQLILQRIETTMKEMDGGIFTLGCAQGMGCNDDATPEVLQVKIENLRMGIHEVTQQDYEYVMGVNPSYYSGCPECPVENVTFPDAMEFIKRLCEMASNKFKYRLPTEAEWEFFAMAGKETKYAGANDIADVAVYGTRSGTNKVKSKVPNALGLYDMTGNVAEWCSDYYHKDAYQKYNGKPAMEENKTKSRVIRGGSFKDSAKQCEIKKRSQMFETEKADWIGFRIVRELNQ